MHPYLFLFVGGVYLVWVASLPVSDKEADSTTDSQQPTLTANGLHPEKSLPMLKSNLLQEKMELRLKKKKERHKVRHSSSRRHFEKQLLVRNKTLALLGIKMETTLPNAIDLLDINPQELPRESPFQNWHRKQSKTPEVLKTTKNVSNFFMNPSKPILEKQKELNDSEPDNDKFTHYQYVVNEETSKNEDIGQLEINFGTAFSKLLDTFQNYSVRSSLVLSPCEQWTGCQEEFKSTFTASLPACPCKYPSSIFYDDKLWDTTQGKHFRWKDASGERLDVYKPGAGYCIRSVVVQSTLTPTVQHCCYDRHQRLLTRGSGAASPNLVSPDVSPRLHDILDLLPWRLCKGDFTIYNSVRQPNNANNCNVNPNEHEFNRQVQLSTYY